MFHLWRPNGIEQYHSRSFVPFQGQKWALGPCRKPGLASQINTNGSLLHMPQQNQQNRSMLVRTWCPLSSAEVIFVPVRSDRSALRNKKKGSTVNHCLFLLFPRIAVVHGMHRVYSLSITNQYQFIWQIWFHSVRSNVVVRALRHALSTEVLLALLQSPRIGEFVVAYGVFATILTPRHTKPYHSSQPATTKGATKVERRSASSPPSS